MENGFAFLAKLIPIMVRDALREGTSVTNKVVEFKHPDELMRTLDIQLQDAPTDNDTLIKACQQIIKYSVKSGHPHFFNQLYGGMDLFGVGGAWLTEALNNSTYTFEVAPVFTLMEK